jgi:hypothetical protein
VSDYVSCPACKGKGIIPLEDAARIKTHARVEADERWHAEQERKRELNQQVLAATLEAKKKKAEDRLAAIERAAFGGPRQTPEQLARLQERLARLERERDQAQPESGAS